MLLQSSGGLCGWVRGGSQELLDRQPTHVWTENPLKWLSEAKSWVCWCTLLTLPRLRCVDTDSRGGYGGASSCHCTENLIYRSKNKQLCLYFLHYLLGVGFSTAADLAAISSCWHFIAVKMTISVCAGLYEPWEPFVLPLTQLLFLSITPLQILIFSSVNINTETSNSSFRLRPQHSQLVSTNTHVVSFALPPFELLLKWSKFQTYFVLWNKNTVKWKQLRWIFDHHKMFRVWANRMGERQTDQQTNRIWQGNMSYKR